MIITNSRYALVGYFITSYPTRAHGIIVKYTMMAKGWTIRKVMGGGGGGEKTKKKFMQEKIPRKKIRAKRKAKKKKFMQKEGLIVTFI